MSPLPPKMFVAADTVALRCRAGGGLEVLLIRRANDPFRGRWALPGGFVEEAEDLPDAAARELQEETGLRPPAMLQVGAWGTPGRDPRGRVVSAVYLAVAGPGEDAVEGADDAAQAAWHPADEPPELAFDHAEILPAALQRLRERCERSHLALAFLKEPFTTAQVEQVLRALGAPRPGDSAGRLLAAARLRREDGGPVPRLRRLASATAPLVEAITMFPLRG
jgi:8-oxo-dGTP diphosphatase